ncbi:MAG TPA: 16S rRNA processing protein RimM [Acidimicrobiaceae bacterium]|nr:16S rRNA processing protein RimM [Acidimicrobiaceae bacterium]HBU39398.1 16S rRNA processing protein RimM [Acidimicrobiaceae bacterium]
MSNLEDLLEVGTVAKAHGTAGEVVVRLITNQTERLDRGSSLMSDLGELVVSKSRQHHDKWLVQFHGVENRTQAEELRGLTLRAEPLDIPDALWVHELIGSVVKEVSGVERGTVKTVVANPASDLLELDTGHLVPLTFVIEFTEGIILVDVPDGLFELS